MGSQWPAMACGMMKIPVFKQTIERCAAALKPFKVDLVKILSDPTETFENVVNSFISIAAVQVALTDLLLFIGIEPDGIVGHSVGEVGKLNIKIFFFYASPRLENLRPTKNPGKFIVGYTFKSPRCIKVIDNR